MAGDLFREIAYRTPEEALASISQLVRELAERPPERFDDRWFYNLLISVPAS